MTTNDLPDLDRRAAECLGWTVEPFTVCEDFGIPQESPPIDRYKNAQGRWEEECWSWRPTQSRDQAAMLEAEIEKRGLQLKYVSLIEEQYIDLSPEQFEFAILTAPPAARVAAAVEVLEDK